MSKDAKLSELESLRAEILEHDDRYYNEGVSTVSDAEYDALKARALMLEAAAKESLLSRQVGAKRTGAFAPAASHMQRMLSLDNLKLKKDETPEMAIDRWLLKASKAATTKTKKKTAKKTKKNGDATTSDSSDSEDSEDSLLFVVAEPKLDGLSVALRYDAETGELMSAATRGDGGQGDDVTANALVVGGVVKKLNPAPGREVEVRGEVMMSKSTFARLRSANKDAGGLVTARNAAAGSLRQSDASITAARNLTFFAHEVVFKSVMKDEEDSYWSCWRAQMERWGFECAGPAAYCSSAAELRDYYEEVCEGRERRDLEIDGVVYKLDSLKARERAGSTAKAPRWAIAHKFDDDAKTAATKLLGITVSVGKRGCLTPVASLEPVQVGGVTVASATLHNAASVRDLLRGREPGDAVLVRRAGDVIPQIVPRPPPGDHAAAGESSYDSWRLPEKCPSCGAKTEVLEEGDEDTRYCPAAFDCPAQAMGRLSHFFARSALDLGAGVGKKKFEQLVEAKVVKNAADLLALGQEDGARLASLDGWGQTSVDKLLDAIDARRKRPVALANFLFALGAPRVGKGAAQKLAEATTSFEDLWALLKAPDTDEAAQHERERLAALRGIGAAAVAAFRQFALDPKEQDLAERAAALLTLG